MRFKLIVHTPTPEIFDSYYYGYGELISQRMTADFNDRDIICTVVDYGDDQYHAEYQAGRFWSGLYYAEIQTYESDKSKV